MIAHAQGARNEARVELVADAEISAFRDPPQRFLEPCEVTLDVEEPVDGEAADDENRLPFAELRRGLEMTAGFDVRA